MTGPELMCQCQRLAAAQRQRFPSTRGYTTIEALSVTQSDKRAPRLATVMRRSCQKRFYEFHRSNIKLSLQILTLRHSNRSQLLIPIWNCSTKSRKKQGFLSRTARRFMLNSSATVVPTQKNYKIP